MRGAAFSYLTADTRQRGFTVGDASVEDFGPQRLAIEFADHRLGQFDPYDDFGNAFMFADTRIEPFT